MSEIVNFNDLDEKEKAIVIASVRDPEDDDVDVGDSPMDAVTVLLQETYVTKEMFDYITCDYENVKNTLSAEGENEIKQKMLANAAVYRTAYRTIIEGMNMGVLYIHTDKEDRVTNPEDFFKDLSPSNPIGFITIFPQDEGYTVDFHVIGTANEKIVVTSERWSEEDLNWLGYDYKDHFRKESEDNDESGKNRAESDKEKI